MPADTPMTAAIKNVQALCYRYPLTTPVQTSFGIMLDRPAVFVRVEDEDGVVGWGEAWSNFPSVGAEHRARIVNEILAPAMVGKVFAGPADLFSYLTEKFAVLVIQTGEYGPFAQSIAGVDLAMWDVFARRNKQPLWRALGGSNPTIQVYASGINPTGAEKTAENALRAGHNAIKLKIGFDPASDRNNLKNLRGIVGDRFFATDVNQGWSPDEAAKLIPAIEEFSLAWIEEPLRADQPWETWQQLKSKIKTPLAGGENVTGVDGFARALDANVFEVVQPDIAKWGGITRCLDVARNVIAAGKTYCPHYLGGGLGLLASAHLLAGAGGAHIGGNGRLEIDFNANPLRDLFIGPVADISNGTVTLTDDHGIGLAPDLSTIEKYRTA